MSNLRNLGISTLGALVVIGVLGTISAASGWWVVAILLIFGALVVNVTTILLVGRHLGRHSRTQERNTKMALRRLTGRVEEAIRLNTEVGSKLDNATETTNTAITETQASTHEAIASVLQKLDDHDADTHKISRHINTTARDSTRQIESMLQIYPRFEDTKLPMPSTGGFAMDAQALGHLISLVEERRPRRILELGSGTSTIWFGYLCRLYGGQVVTLDHLEEYLELTQAAVDRHSLNAHVECRLAPLEQIECDGDNYNWYSMDSLRDLSEIDMVLIDGPPAATGPHARYPSLPKIIDLLSPNATVILDDAHRRDEAKIVEAWQEGFPGFISIEAGTSRLAVLERKV